MLSRTAQNLYWLSRYIERADSTARLIGMGRRMAMLPGASHQDEWRSVMIASGAPVKIGKDERVTEAMAVESLLLSLDNPASIRSSLMFARSNARAVRTALTQDMWEAVNDGWRNLENVDTRTACNDLPQLLEWVRSRSSSLRGAAEAGMLRNDGYDFLRVGMHLERADMMMRLLDVKYYVLLPETEVIGGGRDHHQWTSVLYGNSAIRAYHHVYGADFSPWRIADFLILNEAFPRSLKFSYMRIGESLERLARRYGQRHECHKLTTEMIGHLSDLEMGEIFSMGLHDFVTETLDLNARLSRAIGDAYDF
jgi:uncharacterized alpha-E superfamily protein